MTHSMHSATFAHHFNIGNTTFANGSFGKLGVADAFQFSGAASYGGGETSSAYTVQTTDATPTVINTINLASGSTRIKSEVIGQATTMRCLYNIEGLFYMNAGESATQQGSTTVVSQITSDSALTVDFSIPANVNITRYEDNGDGKTKVNAAGIGLIYSDGDIVRITGSSIPAYNADWVIEQTTVGKFVINLAFAGDGGASISRSTFIDVVVTGKLATTIHWKNVNTKVGVI